MEAKIITIRRNCNATIVDNSNARMALFRRAIAPLFSSIVSFIIWRHSRKLFKQVDSRLGIVRRSFYLGLRRVGWKMLRELKPRLMPGKL
jgi:hypothetical protein